MFIILFIVAIVISCIFVRSLRQTRNIVTDFRNINRPQKFKKEPLPPLYFNGWIPVVDSNFIQGSNVSSFTICGQDIGVFRGSDGKVHVTDAYCPHLGANLGCGGTIVQYVNEDCVQCPLHGWLFGVKDGQCKAVPYAQDMKPPRGVSIKTWHCIEQNGLIYIWYHAEGLEPQWFPPTISEIKSEQMIFRGRTEHIFNCHPQEVARNVADVAHFNFLHGPSKWSSIISHTHDHHWSSCDPPFSHKANIVLTSRVNIFGQPAVKYSLVVEEYGPAIMHVRINVLVFKVLMVQNVTPLGPNETKLVHRVYSQKGLIGLLLGHLILPELDAQLTRDIEIWQRKMYCKNAKLVKEEKALADFTHWFEQFYSENSHRIESKFQDW